MKIDTKEEELRKLVDSLRSVLSESEDPVAALVTVVREAIAPLARSSKEPPKMVAAIRSAIVRSLKTAWPGAQGIADDGEIFRASLDDSEEATTLSIRAHVGNIAPAKVGQCVGTLMNIIGKVFEAQGRPDDFPIMTDAAADVLMNESTLPKPVGQA